MIILLLLILNISFIISPPFGLLEASLPSEGFAEPACRTLRRFEQSLKSTIAHKDGPMCLNSQPKSKHFLYINLFRHFDILAECTKESQEIKKMCVSGIQVDVNCAWPWIYEVGCH